MQIHTYIHLNVKLVKYILEQLLVLEKYIWDTQSDHNPSGR